jgi:hypothetical protein
LVASATVFLLAALSAPSAGAGQVHLFEETFPPSFEYAKSVAIDQANGDVLVVDAITRQILRYHENGTAASFSDLGTNAIDGEGTGPCAPPSPQCDGTPQNGLSFEASNPSLVQIAVDNSGTATDGNIYVTQNLNGGGPVQAIDVFARSGKYLGQLTAAGTTNFSTGGINSPCGVTVDPAGNVYVGADTANAIFKFDPSASAPVNADHVATFSSAEEPCSLAAGAGPSNGSLFVTNFGGREVVKLNGGSGALSYVVHTTASDDHPQHVSVNPANGHVFITTSGGGGVLAQVLEYDASGSESKLIASFAEGSSGVAVNGATGRLYLVRAPELKVYGPLVPIPDPETTTASNIEKTSATLNGTIEINGEELSECFFEYGLTTAYGSTVNCAESLAEIGTDSAEVHADVSGLDEETIYHYRLQASNANGPGKPGEDVQFQTKSKPELLAEWAQGVSLNEATLKAQLNPQSAETTYRFEWGLTAAPYEHSSADVSIGPKPFTHTVSLFLQGLQAGTTYHFRIVAKNEMGTSTGADHAFTTFAPGAGFGPCPNDPFRTAASALLPDCRAYEMVSPVDKNGGDIISGLQGLADPGVYVQAATDSDKLAYGTLFTSFAGEPNNFKFNEYLAERHERGEPGEGWSSEGIHPAVLGDKCCEGVDLGLAREFLAFSDDLCGAWLYSAQGPPFTVDGQPDYPNLYRRENCDPNVGSLEPLVPFPPALPGGTSITYVNKNSVQGLSADTEHVLFVAQAALTDDAAAGANAQVYDRFGGENHLVSVLPNGTGGDPAPGDGLGFAAPVAAEVGGGDGGTLDTAVSTDGSRVYWSSDGKLYRRDHPEQGIVAGECSEAGKACTKLISGSFFSAIFRGASADGSRAIYTEQIPPEGQDLYEFREGEARRLIANEVIGVAGASEDLSRIYFVSRAALAGAGKNSEGEEAVAGQPNLYLNEGGTRSFIARLVEGDVGVNEPGTAVPAYNVGGTEGYIRATRVTPDGARIVFNSRAQLTGYDNADADSGRPTVEVYTYEAGGELDCVSCKRSGGRPEGVRELMIPYRLRTEFDASGPTEVLAAAWIPTWEHPLHASNVLSQDGGRIFFNSNDALLPRDTNGAQDVYEWELAGVGGCDEGDAAFVAQNGGCLYLISSGESPTEAEFWEASPDGKDVFFTTAESLLPQDPGLRDLYDARVGGGFPQRLAPSSCEGEACQSPPPPPGFATPASGSYEGPGNPPLARHCAKGKRKVHRGGKVRCVKRHKHKGRRAGHKRGAGK